MSWPKMRAVPRQGLWKPKRVLMSVDLPAPFGPRRPMVRPERDWVRSVRISRLPRRTDSEESSITGEVGRSGTCPTFVFIACNVNISADGAPGSLPVLEVELVGFLQAE